MAGRCDEAAAACRPPAYGDDLPVNLTGRAAWIEGLRGRRESAIAMMSALLQEQPDYLFGLAFLGRWLAEEGSPETAKAAYRKALALMPSNTDVGTALVQLEIDDGALVAARTTLNVLSRFDNSPPLHLASVQIDLAEQNPAAALATFAALAKQPGDHLGYLDETARKIVAAGHATLLATHLQDLIDDPTCAAEIGYLWAKYGPVRGFVQWCSWLSKMAPSPRTAQATLAFIETLTQGSLGIKLAIAVRWLRPRLTEDNASWATVGYALLRQARAKAALHWLSDWKSRLDLRPWMLLNVVLALRTLGRDREAHAISSHALQLPSDHSLDEHRMWMAWDAMLEGSTEPAARFVAVAQDTEGAIARFVSTLMQSALDVWDDGDPTGRSARLTARVKAAKRALPAASRGRLVRRLSHQLRRATAT